MPKKKTSEVLVIPYGGEIDRTLDMNDKLLTKYPFLNQGYFLSISRSLKDNLIDELCACFANSVETLVLISNLSSTPYGKSILEKYSHFPNIVLINGLYIKPELDLIRRKCKAYIHTHTLCGTAPSLVEMIISQRPILSIDIPQNRNTLDNQGLYFSTFNELKKLIENTRNFTEFIPTRELCERYDWRTIVRAYERTY